MSIALHPTPPAWAPPVPTATDAGTDRLASKRRPLRVAMVAHAAYERDNRVMRVARALADRGDEVDVLALRTDAALPASEVMDGVRVHRIQDRLDKSGGTPLAMLSPLLRFTARAALRLQELSGAWPGSGPFDLVHVHNVPDFLTLAAWPARLRGARVILDLHDLVPEFYAWRFQAGTSGTPGTRSLVVTALRLCERLSASLADHVIVANDLWREKVVQRSVAPHACSVMLNHVDERVFRPRPRVRAFGQDGPLIVFPGGLHAHQGLDVALHAFARLRDTHPDARFHLYGDGPEGAALQQLARELGLGDAVRFFAPLPLHEVADRMAEADLAVVPKRADSFGDEAFSTKILEFMALGVPLVVSRTRIDAHYFDPTEVHFFASGDALRMAQAMAEVLGDAALRESLVEAGLARAARERWGAHRARYLALVDALVATGRAPEPASLEAC
ncbi:MAG: GDP-mannose-dependent alpha-(1-6)-phosphatidylinositol monomannoside mannosyltransferase [Pseudomonadota bacterium]|jgi:glycosyltransferase involved in cell wall biosynthesis